MDIEQDQLLDRPILECPRSIGEEFWLWFLSVARYAQTIASVPGLCVPQGPGCLAARKHIIEHHFLSQSIDAGKESRMLVGHQLFLRDETAERFIDEFFTFLDVIEDFLAKDEEASIEPNPSLGLWVDTLYQSICIRRNNMECQRWLYTQETTSLVAPTEIIQIPI